MARKRRRKSVSRSQREYIKFSRRDLLRPSSWKEPIDDRRVWRPNRRPRDINLIDGEMELDERNRFDRNRYNQIKWKVPEKMMICRRRKTRKVVLFALRKIGKGKGSGNKRRRLTDYSKVRC